MESTTRRYTSPVTPPPLVSRPADVRVPPVSSPLLCLHCGATAGRAGRSLVTFGWGRVVPSNTRG